MIGKLGMDLSDNECKNTSRRNGNRITAAAPAATVTPTEQLQTYPVSPSKCGRQLTPYRLKLAGMPHLRVQDLGVLTVSYLLSQSVGDDVAKRELIAFVSNC